MEVQISPASSFNAKNTNMMHGHGHTTTSQSHEPSAKRIKSDLSFHCIVCSDIYDDPNVLYEHMKERHPELYERENGQDNDDVYGIDDDDDNDVTDGFGAYDSDQEFDNEIDSDLSRLLEPICELRQEDDEDDVNFIENSNHMLVTTNGSANHSISTPVQINTENGLANENHLRLKLQLQLQLQLQNHLLQQNKLNQSEMQAVIMAMDNPQKSPNGQIARPLLLREYNFEYFNLSRSEIISCFFVAQGPGRGRRREIPAQGQEAPPPESCFFQCTQCDSSFIYAGDLAKHVRSHTRNKPYQCNICHKTFTHSTYNALHPEKYHNFQNAEKKIS